MSRRGAAARDNRLPGVWVLLRDVLSFAGGWILIFMEAQRPEVREAILAFGGVAIGIPGLAQGATSLLDAWAARRAGTGDSPSEPPQSVESVS